MPAMHHALLLFAGVFGGAAIWFGIYLVCQLKFPIELKSDRRSYFRSEAQGTIVGLLATIPTAMWICLIAWFW
jgi:hypothetical protein